MTIAPLTPELRAKGFTECNPHDPLGLGPYAPFRPVPFGKILIPKKGGHTPDMGFDVVIHFHGADAVRKYLVQSARSRIVSELLEPAWETPAMDRSGPPTPHPDWAFRKR
ncbi:MAG: hypothetical protein HYZ29_23185 [Myxococcales bacterium]|nr:hypothetical protein [Myxococcales bacterium]